MLTHHLEYHMFTIIHIHTSSYSYLLVIIPDVHDQIAYRRRYILREYRPLSGMETRSVRYIIDNVSFYARIFCKIPAVADEVQDGSSAIGGMIPEHKRITNSSFVFFLYVN